MKSSEQQQANGRIGASAARRPLMIAVFTFMFLGVLGSAPQCAAAAAPTEYQLKAAFLLNFVKFVEWPVAAFRNSESPFLICVLGEDPFGRDLDDTVNGQTIGAREIAIRRSSQVSREDSCQVVFSNDANSVRWQRSVAAMRTSPVLTVLDRGEIVEEAVINLFVEQNKVRFAVNMEAADRAGLRISSKLLRLAKTIRERRKR